MEYDGTVHREKPLEQKKNKKKIQLLVFVIMQIINVDKTQK